MPWYNNYAVLATQASQQQMNAAMEVQRRRESALAAQNQQLWANVHNYSQDPNYGRPLSDVFADIMKEI